MKAALFAYSRQGCETARRVCAALPDAQLRAYTMERFAQGDFLTVSREVYAQSFEWADALIFVGSCGIAVREIAPYVKNKRTDPAVVCIDERGTFVISLLSGHMGGANDLARTLAEAMEATPVITTATDINGEFSVDAWAARQGYAISSMKAAKVVSAAILEENIPLCSDFPIVTGLPHGTVAGDSGEIGISVTWKMKGPFEETLRLIPKVLHLGIGCRKGSDAKTIRETVDMVLEKNGIDSRAVKCVASIDLKAEEPGLLEFCRENNWPVSFYTAQQLGAVEGAFTPSAFVSSVTGVDNVCERSALLGTKELIVRKTAHNGVTVAVAVEDLEVRFG